MKDHQRTCNIPNPPGAFLRGWIALPLAVLLSSLVAVGVTAAPVTIPATATTLTSDTDRMISFRHAERMWQTSDGASHILINQGALAPADTSLKLFSSFDAGLTWIATSWLDNTNRYSTADGVLIGNNLSLAYASKDGQILFSVLHYDSTLKTWSLTNTETVFASSDSNAFNPTIAIEDQGAIWCAFVNQDKASLNSNIRLAHRAVAGVAWEDTGLVFGPTDNVSLTGERSARPVVVSGRVGMVYAVHENTYWAYRLNEWPTNEPWVEQLLHTETPPYDNDPFDSHFSLVADVNKNLHMATTEHGKLLYFRYNGLTQTWRPAKTLTNDIKATYPQISIAQGRLAIFVNALTSVRVFQSANAGSTFTYTTLLTHAAAPSGSGISYANPRIETPGKSTSPIPVFQQFVDGATQKLMFFKVPVN